MAVIIMDGESVEVPDGGPIMYACDELGVPFGCRAGQCGTCIVNVESGGENLEPPNERETAMGLDSDQRLCCQTRIRSGTVEISL